MFSLANASASGASPAPCPKLTTLLQLLSGRTSTSAEMDTAGLVAITPLLGRYFSDHFRTFTPRPDLFPDHLDPFVVARDAGSLPGLGQSVRSPSCAAKPGTACVPKRPRHPGREARARRAPPLERSHRFPVPRSGQDAAGHTERGDAWNARGGHPLPALAFRPPQLLLPSCLRPLGNAP